MTMVYRIKWTNPDSGKYTDVLETKLFGDDVSDLEIEHRIERPKGRSYYAKCTLQVKGNVATLKYLKDEEERWWPGTTELTFSDNTRQQIERVRWAQPETNKFRNLGATWTKQSENEAGAENEVDRLIRWGKITSRKNQAAFSAGLRELYNSKCAVTSCKTVEALEAAHIQVKKGVDNNDLRNGILLRADIHVLFDAGLITLSEDGAYIEVKPELLDDPTYRFLSGKAVKQPNTDKPSHENILHHRSRFCF